MTHLHYSEEYLNGLSLAQLKKLYSDLGCTYQVKDESHIKFWVLAITRFQEEQVAKAKLQLEEKSCATCPKFDPNRGCCNLFDISAKASLAMTSDCINATEFEQAEVAKTATLPPEQPTEVVEVVPVESDLEVASAQIQAKPAYGYNFAVAHGFTFYQKQCDVLCWIGRKDGYRTIAYPKLDNAVGEALRRLNKEGVAGANKLLQVHVEATQLASVHPDGSDCGTPSEAVAVLEQFRLGLAGDNVATYLKQDLLDKPVTELTTVEWDSLKQTVSAEIEEQIESLMEKVEVDGVPDEDFNQLYRLWHGTTLLGTFYRTVFSEKWVARPTGTTEVYRDCESNEDAQYWILYSVVSGSLASDVALAGS